MSDRREHVLAAVEMLKRFYGTPYQGAARAYLGAQLELLKAGK